MIKFTNEGKKAMESVAASSETKLFHFFIEPAHCVACRDLLRVMPGTASPGDEVVMQDGFVFSIDKDTLDMVGDITIDAAGDFPVVYTQRSLDARENY